MTEGAKSLNGGRRSKEILLIDDDDAIRDALNEILLDEGYQVESLTNGHDALDWLQAALHLPRLIITDLMMPRVDGWELCRRLRNTALWATIPVLILSASDSLDLAKLPCGRQPSALRKPLNLQQFLETVEALLTPL